MMSGPDATPAAVSGLPDRRRVIQPCPPPSRAANRGPVRARAPIHLRVPGHAGADYHTLLVRNDDRRRACFDKRHRYASVRLSNRSALRLRAQAARSSRPRTMTRRGSLELGRAFALSKCDPLARHSGKSSRRWIRRQAGASRTGDQCAQHASRRLRSLPRGRIDEGVAGGSWRRFGVGPHRSPSHHHQETTMEQPRIMTRDEWLAARKALLIKEKALTRAQDGLTAERRRLPMVKVDKTTTSTRRRTADARGSLRGSQPADVYHFMLAPDWAEGCASCSLLADHLDSSVVHLEQRDMTLAASPARRWRTSRPSSAEWGGRSRGCRRTAATSTTTITCRSPPIRSPAAPRHLQLQNAGFPNRRRARDQCVLQGYVRHGLPHLLDVCSWW